MAPVSALRRPRLNAHAAWRSRRNTTAAFRPCDQERDRDWLSRPGDGALKDKPLAVIGGSMGRRQVWAHDETLSRSARWHAGWSMRSKLSVPFQTLGKSVADDAGLAANVRDAVGNLVAEVG